MGTKTGQQAQTIRLFIERLYFNLYIMIYHLLKSGQIEKFNGSKWPPGNSWPPCLVKNNSVKITVACERKYGKPRIRKKDVVAFP